MFDHGSSLENENIANIYFNALIGRTEFSLKIINCYFKKIDFVGSSFEGDLYSVKSIKVIDKKGTPLATFRHNNTDHHYNDSSYFNRKEKKTKSFIGFSNRVDFLDFPFFSLPIQLKTGMRIYIQLPNKKKVDLGRIKALGQFEKFFVFYEDFIVIKNVSIHSLRVLVLVKKDVFFS